MNILILCWLILLVAINVMKTQAFFKGSIVTHSLPFQKTRGQIVHGDKETRLYSSVNEGDLSPKIYPVVGGKVDLVVPLGEGVKPLPVSFRAIFAKSEFVEVTYEVPFGLNIQKPPKNFPAPIVDKDGKGGERAGDVLRGTTCWSQGFTAAGAMSDIMSFAGNVKWRKSVFDCTGAPWQQIVEALVSNTAERSKYVTLIFEREISE